MTEGLAVVDEGIDQPLKVMAWGIGRQPVDTHMSAKQALRLAADLIQAANRRLTETGD